MWLRNPLAIGAARVSSRYDILAPTFLKTAGLRRPPLTGRVETSTKSIRTSDGIQRPNPRMKNRLDDAFFMDLASDLMFINSIKQNSSRAGFIRQRLTAHPQTFTKRTQTLDGSRRRRQRTKNRRGVSGRMVGAIANMTSIRPNRCQSGHERHSLMLGAFHQTSWDASASLASGRADFRNIAGSIPIFQPSSIHPYSLGPSIVNGFRISLSSISRTSIPAGYSQTSLLSIPQPSRGQFSLSDWLAFDAIAMTYQLRTMASIRLSVGTLTASASQGGSIGYSSILIPLGSFRIFQQPLTHRLNLGLLTLSVFGLDRRTTSSGERHRLDSGHRSQPSIRPFRIGISMTTAWLLDADRQTADWLMSHGSIRIFQPSIRQSSLGISCQTDWPRLRNTDTILTRTCAESCSSIHGPFHLNGLEHDLVAISSGAHHRMKSRESLTQHSMIGSLIVSAYPINFSDSSRILMSVGSSRIFLRPSIQLRSTGIFNRYDTTVDQQDAGSGIPLRLGSLFRSLIQPSNHGLFQINEWAESGHGGRVYRLMSVGSSETSLRPSIPLYNPGPFIPIEWAGDGHGGQAYLRTPAGYSRTSLLSIPPQDSGRSPLLAQQVDGIGSGGPRSHKAYGLIQPFNRGSSIASAERGHDIGRASSQMSVGSSRIFRPSILRSRPGRFSLISAQSDDSAVASGIPHQSALRFPLSILRSGPLPSSIRIGIGRKSVDSGSLVTIRRGSSRTCLPHLTLRSRPGTSSICGCPSQHHASCGGRRRSKLHALPSTCRQSCQARHSSIKGTGRSERSGNGRLPMNSLPTLNGPFEPASLGRWSWKGQPIHYSLRVPSISRKAMNRRSISYSQWRGNIRTSPSAWHAYART